MHKILHRFLLLLIVGVLNLTPDYSFSKSVEIDKAKWEQDRSEYKFKKIEKEEQDLQEPIDFEPITIPPILKWIVIVIALGLLIYLIIRAFGLDRKFNFNKRNTSARKLGVVIEDLTKEEFIKTEFEKLLEEAIANGDYRLAHRYQFLNTLQIMQSNNWIKWGREKTNHDYLFSTMGESFNPSFHKLVIVFDLVWYGERVIDYSIFQSINKEHEVFNQLIKRN
jgi:hypothetical protein